MASLVEVNVWLAVGIFLVTLLTKILHSFKKIISQMIAEVLVSEISECKQLQLKIKSIENQLASEETLDVRVQLWNKKQSINNKLSPLYDRVKSKESIIHKYSSIVLTILIELCRIVFIFTNRQTPVAVVSSADTLWPLSRIVAFPTGITGAIGCPVWGFTCAIVISMLLSLIVNRTH